MGGMEDFPANHFFQRVLPRTTHLVTSLCTPNAAWRLIWCSRQTNRKQMPHASLSRSLETRIVVVYYCKRYEHSKNCSASKQYLVKKTFSGRISWKYCIVFPGPQWKFYRPSSLLLIATSCNEFFEWSKKTFFSSFSYNLLRSNFVGGHKSNRNEILYQLPPLFLNSCGWGNIILRHAAACPRA